MEITSHLGEGFHSLKLAGRFDANWAPHVGSAIEEAVRGGHRQIELDLSGVNYISSAGVRILLKYHRTLRNARGNLRICAADANVMSVLELSGLAGLLLEEVAAPEPAATAWESAGTTFEEHVLAPDSVLRGRRHGDPEKFATGQCGAGVTATRLGLEDLVIGLGAFGPAESTGVRVGELLCAGGASLAMPTDGSSVPDFQLAEARMVPEASLLYGLTAQGPFSRQLRFESAQSKRGTISLSSLLDAAMERGGYAVGAFAVIAESAGLVGATLLRSPAAACGVSPFGFPEVRDWLSFTSERDEQRAMVIIAGFAARQPGAKLSPFLRPLSPRGGLDGHFHAAIFPYRPLPSGKLDLVSTAEGLTSSGMAKTVLHLLHDDREIEGVGETELMRGAMWMAPVQFSDDGEGRS
jgi:anti-anti-sigma factor